ncbi:putative anti-sigma-B factor antagonist (Anti-anti-sigma-B factor) [Legionella moravica]|uniref:Anti-sigma-B factor antagonist (Anti-anti-sigma-B factor) n=1 Tax=Legionella moravica TaxID=39962 RepID=A0A378K681_9GAMM|nr:MULTISPECIES: STAS domain-containing protein [Legionella]KTD30823.1 putative anti-sigma-B factor antagonist (Anti-anti-sigma-B factor) [Legionella moravica]RUR16901.1 anti-sigma factor antagonist [Legionella sp. km535]STX63351.1 putative anti-sigma-B factor antagonist (Anti-anti-sigma-B factor) [Legionella moravica]
MEKINFKPGSELTFKSVVSVRAKLFKALMDDAATTFCLDLSDVRHCDSAGLALLIEARKLCMHRNKMFEVIGISPETQSLAEFCGVKSILESA